MIAQFVPPVSEAGDDFSVSATYYNDQDLETTLPVDVEGSYIEVDPEVIIDTPGDYDVNLTVSDDDTGGEIKGDVYERSKETYIFNGRGQITGCGIARSSARPNEMPAPSSARPNLFNAKIMLHFAHRFVTVLPLSWTVLSSDFSGPHLA